ncbi:MAG: aspartate/glutamate racemase family protein [Pseudomonadota bacterium]|nr:aspartate/glutamate racemase family protein [Pseudomonadota bacterium]
MGIRIGLIHAVPMAIAPVVQALTDLWPEARPMNLMDDALSPDREAREDLDPLLARRIESLADYAVMAGAHGILYTCSAFGGAIERVKMRLDLPVLKPNEAMFDAALQMGSHIGMVATFAPSVSSMEEEFASLARARSSQARLETRLVSEAMRALRSGDADQHNALVADAAGSLAHCDAIMLAHFSTSTAYALAQQRVKAPVLTSPRSAVLALRAAVAGVQ